MRKQFFAVALLLFTYVSGAADFQQQSWMRVEPIGYRVGIAGEIRAFDPSVATVTPAEVSVAASNMSVRLSAAVNADYRVEMWQAFGEDPRVLGVAPMAEFDMGLQTATVKYDLSVDWMYVVVVLSYEPVRSVVAEVSSFGKGTVTISPKKETYLKGDVLTLTAQPDSGYAFVRWSDGNAEHARGLTVDGDVKLKAMIEPKPCRVTFSAGAGRLLDAGEKRVSFDSAYGALPPCERLGYAFAGWYTAEEGGQRVDSSTTVTNTDEQTLYAHWISTMYSLTVNPNGGRYEGDEDEQVLPVKLFAGLTNLNALAVAERDNYTLKGYYTSKSGGIKVYDENGRNVECDWWTANYPTGTFKGTSDLVVYANWKANGNSVTLEKEGGEGGTDDVSVKYDATLPAISVPTRKGYDFEGYYTSQNGGGTKYYDVSGTGLKPWTSEGTTVLYANWTPHAYKVQYDLFGGTAGAEAPTSAKVGASFRVSAPAKKGYAFAGWNVIGAGVDYTTAKWGVASDAVSTSITNGSAVCIDASRDYVYFLDLATAKDAVVTVLANWSINSYEVTFDANGGETPVPAAKMVTYGEPYGELATCKRVGYTFDGWYTATNGGTQVTGSTKLMTREPQTLYAHWVPNEYSLTVNPNGGLYEGDENEQALPVKLRFGTANLSVLSIATRENYTLKGYYTSKNGGIKVYDAEGRNVVCDYWTADYPDGTFNGLSDLRVYANWTANANNVTLEKEGGEGGADGVSVQYEMPVPALTELPTRKGYDFEGYYTSRNGSGTKYYDANGSGLKTWTSTGTTALYANWTPHVYKVQYDFGAGSAGADAPTSAKVGTAFLVSSPKRTGFVFTGWNVIGAGVDYTTAKWGLAHDSASTSITNGTMACIDPSRDYVYFLDLATAKDASVTLVANWKAGEYSLTVVPNGGVYRDSTGSMTLNEKLFYGATNLNEIGVATYEGHTLLGYATESGGGEYVYDENGLNKAGTYWTDAYPNGTYKETKNLRVYARWNVNTYEISYAPGDFSSGNSYTVVKEHGKRVTLRGETYSRTGYTQGGWSKERDGSVKDYALGEDYTEESAVSLYPYWATNAYVVTFNANGGETPDPESKVVIYNETYGELATCPRTGYELNGWWTEKASGTQVQSNTVVAITGPQTLYAHWTPNEYEVTFDANGGEEPSVPSVTVTYDSTYGELATCLRTGYAFAGWYTTAEGGMKVVGSTKVAITEPQTLYAHWAANTYRVTFDANGGKTSTSSITVTYDSTYGELPLCTRDGYTFDGWYTASDEKVESTTTVSITGEQKLYAHWTANTYEVTFDVNGGDDPSFGSMVVTYDSTYGKLPTCTRVGYAFSGWYTAEGGGNKIESTTKVTITGGQTLWAHWKQGDFSVTVKPNGGTGGSCPSYTFKENVEQTVTITLPTRKGYSISSWTVGGWYGGEPMVSEDKLKIPAGTSGDLTLTPEWEAKKYNVTLKLKDGETYTDGNGEHSGTYRIPEQLVFDEKNLNQISVAVKKDGSVFQGYKLYDGTPIYDRDGRNVNAPDYWTAGYPNGTYSHDGDIELYAEWVAPAKRYSIKVDVSPKGTGTVEGGGDYFEGSNVVLTAKGGAGYSFECWTNDSRVVSTDNPCTFKATADATYVAVFTGDVHTVKFNSMGGEPATTNAAVQVGRAWGAFFPDEPRRDDYRFKGWYSDKTLAQDRLIDGNANVPADPPAELFAKWEEVFVRAVTFVDPDGHNVSVEKEYDKGKPIGEAPAKTKGWTRHGYWRSNETDWDPPLTTIVETNMTVNAKWTCIADVLDCPNSGLVFDAHGNWMVVDDSTAVGGTCMKLSGRSDDETISTEVGKAGILTFKWKGGEGSKLSIRVGDVDSVREYVSSGWQSEGVVVNGACGISFHILGTDFKDSCSIDSVTWSDGKIELKAEADDASHGEVAMNPPGGSYAAGTEVKLSATEKEGFAFEKWSDGSIENPRTISVVSNASYVATFTNCVQEQDLGHVSAALDCSNLVFEATGGWQVYTNREFACLKGNDACLKTSSNDDGTGLTATIRESGTLSFWWKCYTGTNKIKLWVKAGEVVKKELMVGTETLKDWEEIKDVNIQVDEGKEVALTFTCEKNCEYLAVDCITWTPDKQEQE